MLSPLTSQLCKVKFATYDLEWDAGQRLRLIGLYTREGGYTPFAEPKKPYDIISCFLAKVLTPKYHKYRFYAHFGGRFDLMFFLSHLLEKNYFVELIVANSSVVRARVRRGRYFWDFCDSAFLFDRAPLRKIGAAINLPKLDCDFHAPIEELIPYNERDCMILFKAIEQLESILNELGGALELTASSSAMKLFRREYLKAPITTSPIHNRVFRGAYFASRVEVIKSFASKGECYDINSSFPSSMIDFLPGGLNKINKRLGGCSIARVRVKIPHSTYLPPLPYRFKGRIVFPTGEWEGLFTSPDIELVEEFYPRAIQRVFEVYHFDRVNDFSDYIQDIYCRRLAAKDDFWRIVYKLLMNGLYGKTVEREEKEEVIINPPSLACPHNGEHSKNECVRPIVPGIIAVKNVVEVPHAHVPIGAFVTARSRALLYRYMAQCAESLAYVDTDSIYSRVSFQNSSVLGELKHVYTYKNAVFRAPKAYALQAQNVDGGEWYDVVKSKGFRRMSRAEFDDAGAGVDAKTFRALKTALRKGVGESTITKKVKLECLVCQREVEKNCIEHGGLVVPANFTKRRHLADGSTVPHSIESLIKNKKSKKIV